MSKYHHISLLLLLVTLVSACATHPQATAQPPVFQHSFSTSSVPWTNNDFDDAPGKFTFALFSDLTGGERTGVFALAVEQLRLLRPELIISVGDLIEGGSMDHAKLNSEWDSFDERASRAHAPVFHVGGNHDLTNPDMWQVWEQRYGKRYYHFIYKNVLFLVLDTEDNPPDVQQYIHEIRLDAIRIGDTQGWGAFASTEYGQLEERKTGRIGAGQAAYFKNVVEQYPEVRWTYVLMHKPAWQRPDEENFSIVEAALNGRPYTVFYGHLHSYLHEQRHGRDYIRLGTTGGTHKQGDTAAIDHVTLVTVSDEGTDIANLRMSGIFDKTGRIPMNGEKTCLEMCADQ